MRIDRRLILAASAAVVLAACQGEPVGAAAAPSSAGLADMTLGDPKAPVKLIEYASVTCGHCADFHREVYAEIKTRFIDTGKVHYEFREYPTAGPQIAAAGFQLARCGGATNEQYFARIDALFDQQTVILEAAAVGQARSALVNVARAAGVSEAAFDACVRDPAGAQRLQAAIARAHEEHEITGTPTLILNGEKLTDPALYRLPGLADRIEQLLKEG